MRVFGVYRNSFFFKPSYFHKKRVSFTVYAFYFFFSFLRDLRALRHKTWDNTHDSTIFKHTRCWSPSSLPCKLALDHNFLSLAQSKCLSVWLNSLCLFISARIPKSLVVFCLFLPLVYCPSISHLLWKSQHPSLRGPSKKLHIITLRFDTDVLEHLSHLSGCVINIWSHPPSLGGLWLIERAHTRTQTHIIWRMPSIEMYPSPPWRSFCTHTQPSSRISYRYYKSSPPLMVFSSYWFSRAPLGTVEPYPV